jgi:hypothetical protein
VAVTGTLGLLVLAKARSPETRIQTASKNRPWERSRMPASLPARRPLLIFSVPSFVSTVPRPRPCPLRLPRSASSSPPPATWARSACSPSAS